jgi:RNA polymerase sigma-70 factor (ECF subfamily)
MTELERDLTELLDRAAAGDQTALQHVLDLHRDRLKGMVKMRMDPRLKARFDPSDVVQEALLRAAERLPAKFTFAFCRAVGPP